MSEDVLQGGGIRQKRSDLAVGTFVGCDLVFPDDGHSYGYVVSFGGSDILLIKGGKVGTCTVQAGAVLRHEGSFVDKNTGQEGTAVETLTVSFPEGVLARLDYHGTLTLPDDYREESFGVLLAPYVNVPYPGMINARTVEKNASSLKERREKRQAKRKEFIASLAAFAVLALIVCSIGSCTMLMLR